MQTFTVERTIKVRDRFGIEKKNLKTFTRKEKSKEILKRELDWKSKKATATTYKIK